MNKKLTLGVDIGGSKIKMLLWDGQKVLEKWQTKKVGLAELQKGIARFNVPRVGIGVPGLVEAKTGKILKCPNLKCFEGVNLKKDFQKEVRLANDAKCFLLAEAKLGAAKGYSNVLGVIMGTGIGGAVMIDGKPYQGAQGWAGEFGHIIIDQEKTWESLYQASKRNPAEQKRIHSQAIANLINIFNPEIIVLGGRGALMPLRSPMKRFILAPQAQETKVVSAKLGEEAVAIGAALLWG